MAIIFNSGSQITANSQTTTVNMAQGAVVQVVNQTWGGSLSNASSSFSNTFTGSISIQSGNYILVEYYMKQRIDAGNGSWNLCRHQVVCNNTSATIFTSGFNGAQSPTIYQWQKAAMYNPGGGGTYTFQCSASGWNGTTAYFPEDGQGFLRLSEITPGGTI
jgi:hypothetical protein